MDDMDAVALCRDVLLMLDDVDDVDDVKLTR